MPVDKYRSAAQMPPPPPATGDDLVRRIRVVWLRAVLLSGSRYPPGVQRFRSLEEAQAARNEVLRRRAHASTDAR